MKNCFQGRTLHVLDVENLVGAPSFEINDVERIATEYERRVPVGATDHMWLACSHHNAEAVFFGWPGSARRLLGSGPDGADLALLEPLLTESVFERYAGIVIGSGDAEFALPARWLATRGVRVLIASRAKSLSHQLARYFPVVTIDGDFQKAA